MSAIEIRAIFHPSANLDTDFNSESWRRADTLTIDRNWRGEPAPPELRTTAGILWSESEIILGYECAYSELDADENFDVNDERYGLWERDVCEAFIRSPIEPLEKIYKEFEVAPTGQWCDLKIDRLDLTSDWKWRSGMRTAYKINKSEKVWRVAMAIPFDAFGCKPQAGSAWQANLFRISRFNGQRQYLALSPTFTEEPNFHVPEKFVDLLFVE